MPLPHNLYDYCSIRISSLVEKYLVVKRKISFVDKADILLTKLIIRGGDKMIDRPLYIDKIKPYINTPFIKILTGIRRCGKSTILKMLMKKLEEELGVDHNHILSYIFDSFEYDGMTPKEIYEDIKAHFKDEKKYYLFLDEV